MKVLRSERGMAMLMALVTMMLLSVVAAEIVYQSQVYNAIIFRQVDQLRARMLARSGLRIALLQIHAAKKAQEKAKGLGLGNSDAITDQIWKTPLILPPPAPKGFGVAETSALNALNSSLALQGSISVSITGENGRISLNHLVWPKGSEAGGGSGGGGGAGGGGAEDETDKGSKPPPPNQPLTPDQIEQRKKQLEAYRKSVKDLMDQLLQQKKESDEGFNNLYGTLSGEVLVGNLLAWMDPDTKVDGDQRDKLDYYARVEPTPYALKNAPLASETELYMIKGFDDQLANLIASNFTIMATTGINVNEASPLLLRSLIPELGEVELERIQQRKADVALGGPFKDAADFWGFLGTLGNFEAAKKRIEEQGISLMQKEASYRVVVTGQSGSVSKTWVALVGEMPPKLTPTGGAPARPPTTPPPQNPGVAPPSTNKNDSETPHILYLKAD